MPLLRGSSRKTASANISELMRTSTRLSRDPEKRQKQAVAIALSQARRSAKKSGKRPSWLFKTPGAKKYLKRRRKRTVRHPRRR